MPLFHAPDPIHRQIIWASSCAFSPDSIHPDFLNFVHFPLKMYIVSSWSSGHVFLPGMFLVWSPGGRVNLWATPLTPGPSGVHGRHLVNGPGKQKDYWAPLTVKELRTHKIVLIMLSFIWRSRNPPIIFHSGKWLTTKDDSSPCDLDEFHRCSLIHPWWSQTQTFQIFTLAFVND